MFKHTVEYEDFDGKAVVEELHFNVNEAEATILQARYKGELQTHLETLVKKDDQEAMVLFFKDMLMLSVGKREGALLIKNEEVRKNFEYSNAYPTMFMTLAQNPDLARDFIRGIMPKNSLPKDK